MNRNSKKLVAAVVFVAVSALVVVLAVGNITWRPSTEATAGVSALTVDSIALPAVQAQQGNDGGLSQVVMAAIYNEVVPSVVNIQVVQSSMMSQFGMPEGPVGGEGSGWVWDTEGHIVTNNHVVENAESILVIFSNGEWAEAQLVAADPQADLAVIRADIPAGMTLRPLALADEVPPVGYYTLALGSPFGLSGTMTQGIVSAVGRSFPVTDPTQGGSSYSLPDVIQTDAAINPGNSGGPLLDVNGQVIGVNFAIRSEVRANAGVGFAIPVSIVRRVVPALISEGFYAYPFLGLGGSTINPRIAESEAIPEGTLGVFVGSISPDGPSAEAGLQEGDIVTGIDDELVYSFEDLIGYLITETTPGDTVTLEVVRDGETISLPVTIGERPVEQQAGQVQQITVGQAIDIARRAAVEEGILTDVESTSAQLAVQGDTAVWIVELEGGGQQVTVHVDAVTGEVLTTASTD